jgi:two-component system, NarL family, sensor histidine kinase EvgS
MTRRGGFSGIRAQLLLLFGLVLVTAVALLVFDEQLQDRQLSLLEQLNSKSLATLGHTKALSDAYSLRIGGTTFQVRNGLMGWDAAERVVDVAAADIAARWEALDAIGRDEEAARLLAMARTQRTVAAATVNQLQDILESRDAEALARFADAQLFPSLQPVLFALNTLSEIELARVDELVREQARAGRRASLVRIGLSVTLLLLIAGIGARILRNIYRGVESLNSLALGVKHGDFDTEPTFHPRGELVRV